MHAGRARKQPLFEVTHVRVALERKEIEIFEKLPHRQFKLIRPEPFQAPALMRKNVRFIEPTPLGKMPFDLQSCPEWRRCRLSPSHW